MYKKSAVYGRGKRYFLMVFVVRIGVCFVIVASILNSGIYCGTKNVAPNAFRTSTMTPQYMTKFAMDQVCVKLGLNVPKTV